MALQSYHTGEWLLNLIILGLHIGYTELESHNLIKNIFKDHNVVMMISFVENFWYSCLCILPMRKVTCYRRVLILRDSFFAYRRIAQGFGNKPWECLLIELLVGSLIHLIHNVWSIYYGKVFWQAMRIWRERK